MERATYASVINGFYCGLFVCLCGVYRPTLEFFTHHMETSPLPVKGCKCWPMFGTHGHWAVGVRIFNVPHLLWHGPTLYNGLLRGPVILTPVAERLAVEQSLPVFTTQFCCDRGSNPDLPNARRTLYLYATAAVFIVVELERVGWCFVRRLCVFFCDKYKLQSLFQPYRFFPRKTLFWCCHHAMIFSETGNENLSFLRKDIDREHQEVLIGFH